MGVVDLIGALICRRECDRAPARRGHVGATDPVVEEVQICRADGVIADFVKQSDKLLVFLPVNFIELYDFEWEILQCERTKKVRGFVQGLKEFAFLLRNDGGKLVKVANKDHLYPTKGVHHFGAIHAQKNIDTVEKIRPHHRHFIDDNGFEFLVYSCIARLGLLIAYFLRGDVNVEVKESVNCLAFDVERGNPSRSQNDRLLIRILAEVR